MNLLEAMRERRSVRRFEDRAVPRELIEEALAAAVTAPSAGNKQPWRFLVLSRREGIEELARAVRDAVRRIAPAVDPRARDAFASYAEGFSAFASAPVVIVPLWRGVGPLSQMLEGGPDPAVLDMEEGSGLASVAMAVQNLLLRIHELGLGATLMTGGLVAREELRELLRVRGSWRILGLIPVGWPAESPPAPPRKPVAHVARFLEEEP